ncbi:MAG: hypothetical protein ACE14L_05760 [Terriglobales bacterium]
MKSRFPFPVSRFPMGSRFAFCVFRFPSRSDFAFCVFRFPLRWGVIAVVIATGVAGFQSSITTANAAAAAAVELNVDHAGPREVEEQTQRAIVRDYAAAWQAMAQALADNNAGALGDYWAGSARQNLLAAIEQQKSSGLRVRYVDRGHKLEGVFYSTEGSALQLHDTAQVEKQVLDGGKLVASENVTEHYVVVMTPTADRWQVRVLQAVPGNP